MKKQIFDNNKVKVYLTNNFDLADKISVTVTETQNETQRDLQKIESFIKPVTVKLKRFSKEEIEAITKPSQLDIGRRSTKPNRSTNVIEQKLTTSVSVSKQRKINDSSRCVDDVNESKKNGNGVVDDEKVNTSSKSVRTQGMATRSKQIQFASEQSEPSTSGIGRKSLRPTQSMNVIKNKRKIDDDIVGHMELEHSTKKQKLNDDTENPQENIVAQIDFKIGEIVWAKIKGFPHWPCVIRAFHKNMAIVFWFNDYRQTKIYRTQLFKFLPNFDTFSKLFSQKIGLETAAKEALIAYGQQMAQLPK